MTHPILGDELWVVGANRWDDEIAISSEIMSILMDDMRVTGIFYDKQEAKTFAAGENKKYPSLSSRRQFRLYKTFLKFGKIN